MTDAQAPRGTPLGYLLSQYPSANHTYLLREVRALRAAGMPVVVAAVDGDARPLDALTPEEVEERAATFVVKRAGVAGIAAAHLATLVTRPLGYARGVAAALQLAGLDLGRVAYHVFYFAEAVVAGRHLARQGCAHVHTHYATTVAMIASRVFGFELSASIHGSAEFIDPRAQRLREKIAACTFVRAISMYGRSQLMLASPPSEWGKFEVVRLGVNPDEFQLAPQREAPSPFRLLTVGQLQPAKGIHVLLDAVAALVRRGRAVALTIVGDGPDRSALEAHAARLGLRQHVTFTGALNQVAVRGLLAETDVFALASFAEGIPVVLMEAMAAGVACVATRITGIPELVEDGESGRLVTPSDVEALADALDGVISDGRIRRRYAQAGRERVRQRYDLRRNTHVLVDLFTRRVARMPDVIRTRS